MVTHGRRKNSHQIKQTYDLKLNDSIALGKNKRLVLSSLSMSAEMLFLDVAVGELRSGSSILPTFKVN